MRNRTKKIFITIILSIYILTNFFQSAPFYWWNTVYAARYQENQIDYTNIVAILVNDKIYDRIKSDVQRYATTYIQWAWNNQYTSISNSKALVFPIDVDNFSAKNITQLLENIYFDWISWEPSKLVWVVLIWDIPLPVVNQDGYIYPTIYPYVDFEEQKFIRDENSKYFVYNNNPKWQAEIRHWMINFEENISEYNEYFNKLKQYWRNPDKYIWKAIWYDDFIWNNKYFNDNSLNFYLNNFLFAEDLWYHRYSDLMVKVLQGQRNKEMAELIEGLSEINSWEEYTGIEMLEQISDDMNTPTKQIKATIDNWYLSNYTSIFGQKYLKTIKNNVETANRWIEAITWSNWTVSYWDALDTHYIKTEITDETVLRSNWWVEPFIIMLNNALEEAVDKKVSDEKYRLNEVIPLTYLEYEWDKRFLWQCVWQVYNAYENYFFWKSARFTQSMEETTTYRGTYRNYISIDNLTIQDIQNSENPSTDISGLDLNKKSIGWSYEIFATQVDANRWYNYNNSKKENDMYNETKIAKIENRNVNCVSKFLWICRKRRWSAESHTNWSWCDLSEDWDQWWCEDPMEYAIRIRWWASPLNLQANWSSFSWKSGYSYTWATNEVFDIAWSTALPYPNWYEYESNSFESVKKYSNLILRKFSPDTRRLKFKSWNPLKVDPDTFGFGYNYSMDYDVKFTNKIPTFDRNKVNGRNDVSPKNINDVDYFNTYDSNATIQWDIIKIKKTNLWWNPLCKWAGEIYTYKTLDSRVKNDSVTQDELNWDTYKLFKDDRSRVKQFYNEISNFIDTISGTVNAIVWGDTWSLKNKLLYIENTINDINDWFESIFDFDTNQLDNLSTWQINVLASRRENIFNSSTINELSGTIKESQELVKELSWFVDIWWSLFDWLVDYINNEKEKFNINRRTLIFLNSRKNKLRSDIISILNNYSKLKIIVAESSVIYFQIKDIWKEYFLGAVPTSMDVPEKLLEKREYLGGLLWWSWCETKYRSLCDSLTTLIDNYNTSADYINIEKDGINNLRIDEYDDEWNPTNNYDIIRNIFIKLEWSLLFENINNGNMANTIYNNSIRTIPWTWNEDMIWYTEWINMTTSDRPIDSPRYMTFKWISWDKVTFIYPDLYKVEIFSWNTEDGILSLKSTWEIKIAIQNYLIEVVRKYNNYLSKQVQWHNTYYNSNKQAYDLLNRLDPLATPSHVWDEVRPYVLFNENYLIQRLENSIKNSPYFSWEELAQSDPIWFIANMMYYQNISWQKKTIWSTIQDDYDAQRVDFDVNEKITYILDNYLVSDNNKWNFLTPSYRDNWYEVAYVNSDWNDYISYEVTPPILNTISNFSSNYEQPTQNNDEKTLLEQEIINECNIPEQWWVLLFQLSSNWTFESPWRDAIKCRWEKVKEKPFELKINFPFTWDDWSWLESLWWIFDPSYYQNIWDVYMEQLKLLDTDDANDEVINNLDLSHPWDAIKLQEILSYTDIKAKKSSISADNPKWEIIIKSSKILWDVDFYIMDIWNNRVKLLDWDYIISNNINIWTWIYNTWIIRFDPYDGKTLSIEAITPKEWMEVIMFYMCLPWTHDINNCVKSSVRFDIVPWDIKNVSIQMDKHIVLEWGSLPFKVLWTDRYWNNVWELIAQKFETSSSSGTLTLNGVTSGSIKFSNFNKSNFILNAVWGNLDNTTIKIQVSWSIDWIPWVKASDNVLVKKWRIDVYSWSLKLSSGASIITWLSLNLPDENIYVNVDQYWLNQYQTWNLVKLELKLVDTNGNLINFDWQISVKPKNQRLNPWKIVTKTITKNINWQTIDVVQHSFGKTNYFDLSGWTCIVYFLPNFSAWDDIITISMQWIDTVQIPVHIWHASPKIITLSAENDAIYTNSSTNANLKVFDNRNNLVDSDVVVEIRSINDKISLSSPGTITVHSWSFDFDILSHDKWWLWHIYAYIDTHSVPLNQQKPATLSITVQKNMLPEEKLNVMYLNLFGNDWWNQWWYMSRNNKYSESLINNSDKLLAITTQLLSLENIKYFPVIIDNNLQIKNLKWNEIMLSLDNGFVFNIESIWEISVDANSFKMEAANISDEVLERYIIEMTSNIKKGKNILFYIPEQTDSIIESNYIKDSAIYINDEKIFDANDSTFDNNLTVSLSDETIAGYQIWQLQLDDTLIWKLLIAANNDNNISINLRPKSAEYGVSNIWIDWSSNKYWLWFYEIKSQLSNGSFWYKSIQDSHDIMLWIWFTADFKNITNFGWWMSVWESTVPFSSELLINIWDPLLKRVDGNESAKIYDGSGNVKQDTEFDLGLWEVIYSEPGKEIFKVMNIDFNNDNLEDIIVIFKDWTIKILKNYWGTEPFQNLWALMILADRISDVSVWDVDWNWYKDLIIWTEAGWLRVYRNNRWIFDVDWYPVCINVNVNKWEISTRPEKISWLRQIFLEDMDLDGAVDIVTNDGLWFIKIFYGGTTDWNVNYLSTNKYMCDDDWYTRIERNTKLVYQFWIKLDNHSHVLDQSLVHRKWISDTWSGTISPEDLWINSNQLNWNYSMDNIDTLLSSISSFDVSAAESAYQQNQRFKQAWFDIIPVYESWITNESDIDYVEIWCLTWQDPVKIYKIYEDLNNNPIDWNFVDNTWSLVKWDLVRVTVYIEATDNFIWTFIDNISWPRIIPLSEYDTDAFEYFRFDPDDISSWYITSWQISNITGNIHWDLENARYMIDNINLRRWNRLKFSYWLIYNDYQAFDIGVSPLTWDDYSEFVLPSESLSSYSHDNYPDISTQPVDGCNDSMFVFFNNWSGTGRNYNQKFMDLARIVNEYNEQSTTEASNIQDDVLGDVWDAAWDWDVQEVMEQIWWFTDIMETLDRKWMLQNQGLLENISYLWETINIWSEILDGLTNDTIKKIDKVIWGLCNGIDLWSLWLWWGWWCWLPVPFNQAFLWVWKYHVFGCYEIPILSQTIWKWIPILNIPTTYITPVWTYPFIWAFWLPTKVAWTDTYFLWAPTWTYPSVFRLYLMPTLTLDLWIALCFWLQTVWARIPDPFGSIAWNCVVFSVPLCKKSNSDSQGSNSTTEIPYEYTLLKWCSKQNIPCYVWNNESSSPFVLWWSSANSYSFQPIIPDWSYAGWFINIEIKPETSTSYTEDNSFNIGSITLEWWAQSQNKILWSSEQWLIDKIVKKRLDKQIKYIMNNLTNFKISVAWPDFGSMFSNVPSVSDIKESMNFNNTKKEVCENNKWIWHENWSYCEDTQASLKLKCENKWMKRDQNSQSCTTKDSSLSALDAWWKKTLPSRWQVSSLSDYTNPFDKLSEVFKDTPLVNISTQDITVDVPMLSSEDITSYISMSQSRINRQTEILWEWKNFFTSIIGFCGWRTNINWTEDLQEAINELKEKYKEIDAYSQTEEDDQLVENLQWKINALENLKQKYNLSELWDYKVFEAEDGWFYVYTKYSDWANSIIPGDVYLYFNKENNNLSMVTSWYDLIIDNSLLKSKISIEKNNQPINNSWVNIKKDKERIYHSCAEIFMDWTIDSALNWFINMQSSAETLTMSVKQNIETLQLYKQFPLELYERIHVWDRYLWEISSLINSTMWMFSMWMETNANRYSQYIDAIITLMTTLETYQLIIDLSADWSESCSTCTNDNYDQFSCKLGWICDMLHIELPIVEIPPTKIPSFYLDFSEIHLETNIKLPKFKFNPVAVPLPQLPNLPSPPDIDLSLSLDEAASAGIQGVQNILTQLIWIDFSSLNINANLPLIPSPPVLPEIPSFIPSVEMELPVLPPAPKIPELPNKIQSAIKWAKIIGKILCIVKWKIWLVAESSIKAKVEQITQRDYEVPYWDNLDQTLSDWNKTATASMPSVLANIFTWVNALLQTNEFKEAKLKWFDVSLQTYVNLQLNLDHFYSFLERVVNDINDKSRKITDYESLATNYVSNISKDVTDRLNTCVNHPISIECLGSWAAEMVRAYNEKLEKFNRYQRLLNTNFNWLWDALTEVENKKDRMQNLQKEMQNLSSELQEDRTLINRYTSELAGTSDEGEREYLLSRIEYIQKDIDRIESKISDIRQEIMVIQQEIDELNRKYRNLINSYNELIENYNRIKHELDEIKESLNRKKEEIINQINNEIEENGQNVNFENIKILDNKVSSWVQEIENRKSLDIQNRYENLQNLYKEVDWVVSYVDYDSEINESNIKILKDTLSEIYDQAKNKDIKNRAQEYISLISMNREIKANTESISNIENQYTNIINEHITNNENIENLIENNYDEFIASVSNNDTALVSNDSLNIVLATNLFDMDKNSIKALEKQDNLIKKYMDYNINNVEWYLNALENNSAENLNMSDEVYKMSKEYLNKIKNLSDVVYNTLDDIAFNNDQIWNVEDKTLVAQLWWGWGWWWNNWTQSPNTSVDIANYIDWYTINTKEGSFLLANNDYVNKFQSKYILADINWTGGSDLILWDNYNVYIKYGWGNTNFDNTNYDNASKFYYYKIRSYDSLLSDSDNWFIKMSNNLVVKLIDTNREVKNFKYAWQTFDTIKVSRQNSTTFGDQIDGYLLKMIHRVDQFNDHESMMWLRNNEELFDKKYILVLPQEAEITGAKLETEDWILSNIETLIWTGSAIFSLMYYNKSANTIDLTITDLPRNWQYSEVYTLNYINDTYNISSTNSNQIVAWPQIIADDRWPTPTIKLFRPAINDFVSEWINLQWYVWTNYILQVDREDNVALDRTRIANELWESVVTQENIGSQTGYIELSWLYFTWKQNLSFYVWWEDINWNQYVTEVNLIIKVPTISIIDVLKWNQNLTYSNGNILNWSLNNFISQSNSATQNNVTSYRNYVSENITQNTTQTNNNDETSLTIVAQLENTIDSWYVQFLRNRISDKREILTGKVWWNNIYSFQVTPTNTEIYWWYFDFGNDIWLYSQSGDMVAKVNPENWKITVSPWYENTISIKLDYSPKIPIVKVMEWGTTIFWIIFSWRELVDLSLLWDWLSIEPLDNELYWEFDWWQAVLRNWQVLLYISPKWQIYTDTTLYWEYWFDNLTDSVTYTFRTSQNWSNLWIVKIKIKNLLEY